MRQPRQRPTRSRPSGASRPGFGALRSPALLLSLLLSAAGCRLGTSPADLDPSLSPARSDRTLSTDRTRYTAGAVAVIRLRNATSGELGYNLCTSSLERGVPAGWEPVANDRPCTRELRILAPGAVATYEQRLAPELANGNYRFRASVEHMGAGRAEQVESNTFEIVR